MAGQTTWNKSTVSAGADPWNLVPDVKKALETANVAVVVSSDAERDALTPPGGKYPGMLVVRADVAGTPVERYDGTLWRRGLRVEIGQGANDPTHASGVTTVTTNASGDATITFPVAFGSVLKSANITDATDPANLGAVLLKLTYGSSDKTKITFRAYTTAGAALASQSVAIAWAADGY